MGAIDLNNLMEKTSGYVICDRIVGPANELENLRATKNGNNDHNAVGKTIQELTIWVNTQCSINTAHKIALSTSINKEFNSEPERATSYFMGSSIKYVGVWNMGQHGSSSNLDRQYDGEGIRDTGSNFLSTTGLAKMDLINNKDHDVTLTVSTYVSVDDADRIVKLTSGKVQFEKGILDSFENLRNQCSISDKLRNITNRTNSARPFTVYESGAFSLTDERK